MKFKLFQLVLATTMVAAPGRAQSVISTILGETPNSPNGVPATSVSLNVPSGAASDGHGNIYVSLRSAHQVVRIDSSGTLWLVAGTGALGSQGPSGDGGPATSATLSLPLGLAFDTSGNLYICDGGSNKIRMVDTSGIIHTIAGSGPNTNTGDGGPATSATMDSPSAIAFDAAGDLLIADTLNNEIRMVTPARIMMKVAGTGNAAYDGDNGTVATAAFSSPTGIAVDQFGDIYVADTGNQRVRMIAPNGVTSLITGDGTAGSFGDGRQADIAEVHNPGPLAFDTAGNLYIADIGNDRVRVINMTTGVISNYAGSGTAAAGGDGGWAIDANLNLQSIAMDPQNNMIVADGSNYRVRFVTASNGIINTIAGNGLYGYNPTNLLISGGTLYFSDSNANRIRQMQLSGGAASVSLEAGNGTSTFSDNDDTALTGRLNGPRGLTMDSKGNIYFADTINNVVREITPEGALVTLAGNDVNYDLGDGALAIDSQVSQPIDVAVASGNLYILEEQGNKIRVITPNGDINSYAGTGAAGVPSSPTGVALSEPFNNPQGMISDSAGALYVADTGNNLIRKITTDGNVATIVGTGAPGYTGDGGPATSATLRSPTGIALDSYGNLFIADERNDVIREVGADGIISTVAGVAGSTPVATYNGEGSPATKYALNLPGAVVIGPNCSILIADVANQRIRQVTLSVAYSITTNPPGLQVVADGQTLTTPVVLNWSPGTTHTLTAPATQTGASGVQYVYTGATQSISVTCGAPRASASISLTAQPATAAGDPNPPAGNRRVRR